MSKPYPALCRDCKHSKPEEHREWNLRCTHPTVNAKDHWSLAGGTANHGSPCTSEREKRVWWAACGMRGRLWESRRAEREPTTQSILVELADGTLIHKSRAELALDDRVVFDGPDAFKSVREAQAKLEADVAAAGGLDAWRASQAPAPAGCVISSNGGFVLGDAPAADEIASRLRALSDRLANNRPLLTLPPGQAHAAAMLCASAAAHIEYGGLAPQAADERAEFDSMWSAWRASASRSGAVHAAPNADQVHPAAASLGAPVARAADGRSLSTVDVLDDAAIVCGRRDEFGHRHRATASGLRAIEAAIRDVLARAITGDAPAGYALVPLDAFEALRASPLPADQGDQQ